MARMKDEWKRREECKGDVSMVTSAVRIIEYPDSTSTIQYENNTRHTDNNRSIDTIPLSIAIFCLPSCFLSLPFN